MFTNNDVRELRQKTCDSCEKKTGVRCSECGCFLMLLRKVESASCPLEKWQKQYDNWNEDTTTWDETE